MLTAAKAMLLDGTDYKAGEEISPAKWASLSVRTQKVLTRTRRVQSSELAVAVKSPTISPTVKRGRPRKER